MTRAAIAWTLFVWGLCSLPSATIPAVSFLPFSFDKWVHAGLFAVFGALWLLARPGEATRVFAWGVAFGIGIELWQWMLPIGRLADPLDAAADVVGLALGIGLVWAVGNVSGRGVSR